ncbi:hypothetical protein LRAMOSA01389 [Lichtheimia ramosa]|uniref:BZIP domain-containing protein n=1 Tax=Lichtheimia ramosa TaxID=688394 RepID=A0A077WJ97_9FUNG|nr:hypothetical protein LRAMOSA01389 [Lichtheimia ramosa]
MTEIAFEHFDPAIELCSVDENGRLVRPRKKPGRKPNPPSPAQRKAQNRAAQRAFRERKRREMKDAEFKVQRALCARDEAVREAKKLRRRVKQLEFENNFLRGHVLSLKMACYANRVDVDNYVQKGTRDYLGNEKMQKSAARGIPANLEFFLDHDHHVIYLQDDYIPASIDNNSSATHSPEPSSIASASSASSINTTSSAFNPFEALLLEPKLLARGQHAMPGSFDDMSDPTMMEPLPPLDLTQTVSALAPQLHQLQQAYNGQLVDPSIIQGLVHTQMVSGLMDQITKPDFTIDQIPPELAALIPSEWRSSLQDYSDRAPSMQAQANTKQPSEEIAEIWDQLLNQQSLPPTKKSRCTIGPNGERTYPPMTPIEFVEELRLIPRKDKKFLTMFEPTELQRKVPHDLRIDVIPGADMRDQMILFQDFYDANELFSFLLDSAMFMGGSIGNQDHWFVPPSFLRKYWFLCPSKVPDRVDNCVEIVFYLGERMRDMMSTRKQLYMERERYPHYFPSITPPSNKANIEEISLQDSPNNDMLIDPPPVSATTPETDHQYQDDFDEDSGDTETDSNSDVNSIPVTDDMPTGNAINIMENMPRFTSIGTLR